MRVGARLRVVACGAGLALAFALPPTTLVGRFLPREYAARQSLLVAGVWTLKAFLALNAAIWLAWPRAARLLEATRAPEAGDEPAEAGPGRVEWSLLGGLTLLAAVHHGWGLDAGLTYDEIYFAQAMVQKTPLHIVAIGSPMGQPFMNSLAWVSTHLLGFSEVTMRLPALILAVAAVPVTYFLARRRLGRAVAIGAAALLAVSTYAIPCAQETKGYAATPVLALAATWTFLAAQRHGGRGRWAAYGLFAFFLAYAHVVALLVVGGHLLIALAGPGRARVLPALAVTLAYVAGALALVFAVPLPLMLKSVRTAHETHYGTSALTSELVGSFGAPFADSPWSWALALLALIGAVRLWRIDRTLLGAFVLPVALGLAANETFMKYMYVRYFVFALPPYTILAALGGLTAATAAGDLAARAGLRPAVARGAGLALAMVLLASWAGLSVQGFRGYHARERYPFKAVARHLAALPEGSNVVAGGFGADKYRFYAPEVRQVSDLAALAADIERDRPEYVVTFLHRVFQSEATALGRDPLAAYRLVRRVACHREEDGNFEDGLIWRRAADAPGAVEMTATGAAAGGAAPSGGGR